MKNYTKSLLTFLIAVIAILCASCGSSKSENEPTKILSLQGFKTEIINNNLASNENAEMYSMIGASDGFGFVDPEFSVYSYTDLDNEYYQSAVKNGYIELFGSKNDVIVNNNLVLYCDNESQCKSIIQLFKDWSTEATSTSETTTENNDTILNEINNWLISDIWNDGFCDISHYLSNGKNSIGESMDIDFIVQQLKKKMEQKQHYDEFINKLDNQNIKDIWAKLSPEIDRLFEIVTTNTLTPESSIAFDTGIFVQYRNAFSDYPVY